MDIVVIEIICILTWIMHLKKLFQFIIQV